MVRLTDRVLVMLDDEQRVALVGEPVDGVKKDAVVSRMQSYRRLVEYVADTPEVAAELCGQTNALGFTAGKRRRAAVEREVSESHFLKEGEARQDLGDRVVSNGRLASLEPEVSEELLHAVDRHCTEVRNASVVPAHRPCNGIQTSSQTVGAKLRPLRVAKVGVEVLLLFLRLLERRSDETVA